MRVKALTFQGRPMSETPTPEARQMMKPLPIGRDGKILPITERGANDQTIQERADFLAFEIFNDRLAPESEIADAIAREIRRFAKRTAR
jgi:hypothetical protein